MYRYTSRNIYNAYTAAFDNDMSTYIFIFTMRYISNLDKIQTTPLQHGYNQFEIIMNVIYCPDPDVGIGIFICMHIYVCI